MDAWLRRLIRIGGRLFTIPMQQMAFYECSRREH